MTDLTTLALQHKSIAVVGMGKTRERQTANCLLAGAAGKGVVLGLTSTGRDGKGQMSSALAETADISAGAGSAGHLNPKCRHGNSKAGDTKHTGIYNPLGEIFIARVREAGSVEISGPERTEDLRTVIDKLQDYAQLVIVDGAIDRIAASAPAVTDAAVLATGAVIGRDVEKVVELTVHTAGVLTIPALDVGEQGMKLLAQGKTGVINQQGQIKPLPLLTAIDAPPEILDYLSPEYNNLLIGGALSDPLAELLLQASWKIPGLSAVVEDGTKIFVEPQRWQRLRRRVSVSAARPINLIAVTVNPVDPRPAPAGEGIGGEPAGVAAKDIGVIPWRRRLGLWPLLMTLPQTESALIKVLGELRPQPLGKLLKARMRLAGPGCEEWLAAEWRLVADACTMAAGFRSRILNGV